MSKWKCTNHTLPGPLLEVEMSKKCMPLWREAHFQVKMYKTPQVRTTFGSWDVEKVHAVVARSTFPSQNVQTTPASDHLWKKCTPLWREAHFEVKMLKTPGGRTTFGGSDVVSRGRRKGLWTLSKVSKTWGVCSIFNYNHYTTLHSNTLHYNYTFTTVHYTTLHYTPLHSTPLHSTTLHWITFNYTQLRSITQHYTTLHYTQLHYTTLHYTTTTTTTTLIALHHTTLHDTTQHTTQHYTTLHHTTPHNTTLNYTTLHYPTPHCITLHHSTLHCITLHYIALHYNTLITPPHMQLQLHYTKITLHLNYNSLHYNYSYSCTTPHYIQQLWVRWPTRWPLQPLQPLQKTQLQPPFGPSVDSPCHPWFTTTNLSYRFPIFETSATALRGTTGKRS